MRLPDDERKAPFSIDAQELLRRADKGVAPLLGYARERRRVVDLLCLLLGDQLLEGRDPRRPANSLSAAIFLGLVKPSLSAMRRYSMARSFLPARTQPLAM